MKVIYTGIFFSGEHAKKLREREPSPLEMRTNLHITFAFKPSDAQLFPKELLGKKVPVQVVGYGNDDKNAGFCVELPAEVTPYYHKSAQTHITTSLAMDAKPIDSGKLTFEPLQRPFAVTGRIGYFTDQGIKFK